jgi:hypothetical protein
MLRPLDDPDPSLRDEAAEIIAKAPKRIPATRLLKYLSEDYPPNVRMAALVRTLKEEYTEKELADKNRRGFVYDDSVKAKWAKVMNDLMAGPVCPPYFAEAVRAADRDEEWQVKPENQLIVFRRILASEECKAIGHIYRFLPKDQAIAELTTWYPLESDAEVRLIMLEILKYCGRDVVTARTKARPVFELATKDYDKKNADFAKECLEKWKTTPPEEKKGDDR